MADLLQDVLWERVVGSPGIGVEDVLQALIVGSPGIGSADVFRVHVVGSPGTLDLKLLVKLAIAVATLPRP